MKLIPILLFSALALPGSAQDRMQVGLAYASQGSLDYTLTGSSTVGTQTSTYGGTFTPDPNTGLGLDLGYKVFSDLWVTAAYHPRSTSALKVTELPTMGSSAPQVASSKIGMEYVSLGGQWRWHPTVDLGVGAELRSIKLTNDDKSVSESRVTPWLTGMVGYTVKTQTSVKPYFGLGLAFSLQHPATFSGADLIMGNAKNLLASFEPVVEVCLHAGVQF